MKRVIASLFGTVAGLVMLLSFKTHSQSNGTVAAAVTTNGDANGGATTSSGSSPGTSSSTGTRSTSGTGSTSGTSSTSGVSSAKSGTYTGDSVNTRWGPVQVQITATNGKVTSATIHSVGGTSTVVKAGAWSRTITLQRGESATVRPGTSPS